MTTIKMVASISKLGMRKRCAAIVPEKRLNVPIDSLIRQDVQSEKARRKRRGFRLNGRMVR